MSEQLPVLEFGATLPAYADTLIIEQHGAMSHLIFCYTQRECVGHDRNVSVVSCRVIVPTGVLAQLARQLATPVATVEAPDEGLAVH
jgi:hypothetical protein